LLKSEARIQKSEYKASLGPLAESRTGSDRFNSRTICPASPFHFSLLALTPVPH